MKPPTKQCIARSIAYSLTVTGLVLSLTLVGLSSLAEGTAPIQYVTKYLSSAHKALASQLNLPVYGVFDMGHKPSVQITTESISGGTLRFVMHGRHYRYPILDTYYVKATYEDVAGHVFDESPWIAFEPFESDTNEKPTWFEKLEDVSGYYGHVQATLNVPYGTSVINIVGQTKATAPQSPNALLGYVSQIEAP